MDLSRVSLFEATSYQNAISRKRNYEEWARGLDLAGYLRRDEIVDTHQHAINGKLKTWVLAPVDNPETPDFLCSCETFQRQALIRKSTFVKPQKVIAYGISSVFCPPENRNKGYATHMMRLLHYVLAPEGELGDFPEIWGSPPKRSPDVGNAAFSMLWSEIGGGFYLKAGWNPSNTGWKMKGHVNTVWRCREVSEPLVGVRWLSESDCVQLWEEDAQFIEESFSHLTTPLAEQTSCAFLSNEGVAAFQIRRSIMYLPGSPHLPMPKYWGAEVVAETEKAYATWVVDTSRSPASLAITRLRATEQSFSMLLLAAMEAAKQNNCASVEVCSLDSSLKKLADNLGGEDTREDLSCIPSLAWYGPEQADDVDFLFNERYCYC